MMTALEVSMYRISKLLQETGWSQAELARRIGVTQQTVQQWVSGKATPKASSLDKLVEVSGHPLHWFLLPPEEGEQIFTPDTMKIGPRQRELLQAFSAFPEEDQEKMLQEIKDKKKSMEETIARWLAAQKSRRA
ncbi:helix-turn-helix domain-containing protein [Escherichia coli]